MRRAEFFNMVNKEIENEGYYFTGFCFLVIAMFSWVASVSRLRTSTLMTTIHVIIYLKSTIIITAHTSKRTKRT